MRIYLRRSFIRRPYIIRNVFGWSVWVGGFGLIVVARKDGI